MDYIVNAHTDAHYNMAFDEFCLEHLSSDAPVFCIWQNAPSVIIGKNQNVYAEVNLRYLEENHIKLARRVTGGGAVYHDLQNVNFSIVASTRNFDDDVAQLLDAVIQALRKMGVDAYFSGRNDILVDERKVSGTAKRVSHDRLMVHGTLMYDVDLVPLAHALDVDGSKLNAKGIASVRSRVANLKDYLPQYHDVRHFMKALQDLLADGGREITLSEADLTLIEQMRKEKFSTWEWNYGSSPVVSFSSTQKFTCGTIEVNATVNKGILTSIQFMGDYLGNLPSEELSNQLQGCLFNMRALNDKLKEICIGQYFDSLSAEELTRLILSVQD